MPPPSADEQAIIDEERRQKLPSFPERSELTRKERVATAALCTLMGYLGMGPSFCPSGVYRIFMLLNHKYYKMIMRWGALTHIFIVTFLEPPPRLYGQTPEEILANGYSVSNAMTVDVCMVFMYVLNTFLQLCVEYASYGWKIRKFLKVQIVVVSLLTLDMMWNASRPTFGVRPFRFLRPVVYIMLDHQMRMLLDSCVHTFIPLMKTFLVLVLAQVFFAIVGLNMFSGTIDQNSLGAACWVEAGQRHPFQNFGRSFLTMYFLGVADNYPVVVYPFNTCDCAFLALNGTRYVANDIPDCVMRTYVSGLYFTTYLVVVYLCLGNCVLAVCYFYFENLSKQSVMHSFMLQRFSVIAAFHYLENGSGLLYKNEFSKYCDMLSNFMNIDPRQHQVLYEIMDDDNSGYITLSEFYPFCDMLHIKMQFYNDATRFACYASWKKSEAKARLKRWLEKAYGPLPVIDWVMMCLVLVNTLLASLESTRRETQKRYSDVTCFIFAFEVIIKCMGFGIRTYFLEFWNRFDFTISMASVAAFSSQRVNESIKDNYAGTFALIQCMRLLRLVGVMNKLATRRGAQDGKENYFSKIIEALATTIPVCMNALLLLIFYMVVFAMITMELLSEKDPNSRSATYSTGFIDYKYGDEKMFDWSDFMASFQSVFIIIVGNTWGVLVENAMNVAENQNLMWFFMLGHFIGVFLMLNIIQSLFVSAFATLLDEESYTLTHEFQVADLVKRNIGKKAKDGHDEFRIKNHKRIAKLEYLMATEEECTENFEMWSRTEGRKRPMELNGILLNQTIDVLDFELREQSKLSRKEKKKRKNKKDGKKVHIDESTGMQVALQGRLARKKSSLNNKRSSKKAW